MRKTTKKEITVFEPHPEMFEWQGVDNVVKSPIFAVILKRHAGRDYYKKQLETKIKELKGEQKWTITYLQDL